jgi:hypothetical protein
MWRLATSLEPAEYACDPFQDYVPRAVDSAPTAEGLVCAACSHYIRLEVGAVWDEHGGARCMGCASAAALLSTHRTRMAEQPRPGVAEGASSHLVEERRREPLHDSHAAAMADQASAARHLQLLARRDPERAERLRDGMARTALELGDVAAQGVLAAYDEAEALCAESLCMEALCRGREGAPALGAAACGLAAPTADGRRALAASVFDELVRRWEAHVPMSLLRMLMEVIEGRCAWSEPKAVRETREAAGASNELTCQAPADPDLDSRADASLQDIVRRARLRCGSALEARGFQLACPGIDVGIVVDAAPNPTCSQ